MTSVFHILVWTIHLLISYQIIRNHNPPFASIPVLATIEVFAQNILLFSFFSIRSSRWQGGDEVCSLMVRLTMWESIFTDNNSSIASQLIDRFYIIFRYIVKKSNLFYIYKSLKLCHLYIYGREELCPNYKWCGRVMKVIDQPCWYFFEVIP